jgi:hypothetical protein
MIKVGREASTKTGDESRLRGFTVRAVNKSKKVKKDNARLTVCESRDRL